MRLLRSLLTVVVALTFSASFLSAAGIYGEKMFAQKIRGEFISGQYEYKNDGSFKKIHGKDLKRTKGVRCTTILKTLKIKTKQQLEELSANNGEKMIAAFEKQIHKTYTKHTQYMAGKWKYALENYKLLVEKDKHDIAAGFKREGGTNLRTQQIMFFLNQKRVGYEPAICN